jgi:hypothetical protein
MLIGAKRARFARPFYGSKQIMDRRELKPEFISKFLLALGI